MTQQNRKRPPTMNDVAKRAGVSQTTVSFIINANPHARISDDTRDRVLQAIDDLGYRPNALAQGLKTSQTQIIGFITDYIATTPFAGQIVQGAQEAAWQHGKILLLANTEGKPAMESRAVETMLERKVDSIIYATMYHRAVQVPDVIREVPTVLLDCFVEDQSLPSVVPDEVQGGRDAIRELIAKGHQRIAFINNIETVPAAFGRLEGYRQALAEANIIYDESLVLRLESTSLDVRDNIHRVFDLSEPPTAVFCFNDLMAMGAFQGLQRLGLRVPEDVAVIGFDNLSIIASQLSPGLTTMQLPHFEMGRWAVEYLVEHSDPSNSNPIQHIIECPLIRRDSH